MAVVNQSNPQDNLPAAVCLLCCEDNVLLTLGACSHTSCKACLAKCIEKEETSGQIAATCPFCRASLWTDDVISIIGRDLKPGGTTDAVNEETLIQKNPHHQTFELAPAALVLFLP